MARIGVNPARGQVTQQRPQPITVAMITYIPDQSGYFTHRLEVLRLALDSLYAHTAQPHDVLVFDNASCAPVREMLRQAQAAGQINFLLLSDRNVGKIDALRILAQAAPGEIVAYSDDDILFYPGWLEAQLDILQRFPQAGMVSGAPVRDAARHAAHSLSAAADAPPPGVTVDRLRDIPDEWEADWAVSTGRDAQAHLQSTADVLDTLFRWQPPDGAAPVEALAGSDHFQFVARKADLLRALPADWSGKLMGAMRELDQAFDNLGLLRLSTRQRCTRHLGNTLHPGVAAELQALGLSVQTGAAAAASPAPRSRSWLLRLPGMRRLLHAIYHAIFRLLYA